MTLYAHVSCAAFLSERDSQICGFSFQKTQRGIYFIFDLGAFNLAPKTVFMQIWKPARWIIAALWFIHLLNWNIACLSASKMNRLIGRTFTELLQIVATDIAL